MEAIRGSLNASLEVLNLLVDSSRNMHARYSSDRQFATRCTSSRLEL